ncbi:MAG: matrixin family metalloprotease [Thaumarchaeota archaeon]|nr:MAG: matrixin family metalloprotease [Nitrososphaerota archaeon]
MDEHFLRELQQIQLIQKKLIQKLENTQNVDNPEHIPEIIEDLDQFSNFTTSLTKTLSNKKTIDRELLTKLNHELRTPLVPIRGYTDMLLSEKFGKLSDEQTNRLRIVNSNILRLEEIIINLLNEKQFNVTESEKKDQSSPSQVIKELEQEKMILGKMVQNEEKKNFQLSRKHILTIAGFIVVIGIVITAYSLFVVQLVGQEYKVPNTGSRNDGYIIQNLSGETINTWLSWRLVDGTVLHVNVIDADKYPGKLDLIKEVLLSQQAIEIDDSLLGNGPKGSTSTYYTGWGGALAKASKDPTQLYIPTKLDVIESHTGAGDIIIKLTDEQSGDGYSGFTKSIADPSQHQILKSGITIYEVSKLSDEQFKTILRHELGHAFGLAHATSPEDLMHATIQTDYPYISQCDIDAIKSLYNGNRKSQVTC